MMTASEQTELYLEMIGGGQTLTLATQVKKGEFHTSALVGTTLNLDLLRTNIYILVGVPNQAGDSRREVKGSNVVSADIDAKDYPGGKPAILRNIESLPNPPTMVVDSGHGYHIYYQLEEMLENAALINERNKRLAHRLGADPTCNAKRLLRIPGTLNNKHLIEPEKHTQAVQCKIVSYTGRRYRYNETPEDAILSKLPISLCLQIFAGCNPLQDRSQFDMQLCQNLKKQRVVRHELVHLLNNYPFSGKIADERAKNNDQHQIAMLVTKIYDSNFGSSTPTQVVWEIKSLTQLREESKPAFVIEDLLPIGGVGILAAPPKARKSWMAMDMAYSVATGQSWLTFDVSKPRKVIYLQAELPDWMVSSRFQQLYGAETPENLGVITVNAANLEQDVSWLCDAVQQFGAELVIIDPIANLARFDENSSDDVGGFFDKLTALKDLNCAVLLVHHARKITAGEKVTPQHIRGSSVFFARPDAIITVTPEGHNAGFINFELRAGAPREELHVQVDQRGAFRVFHREPPPKLRSFQEVFEEQALLKSQMQVHEAVHDSETRLSPMQHTPSSDLSRRDLSETQPSVERTTLVLPELPNTMGVEPPIHRGDTWKSSG